MSPTYIMIRGLGQYIEAMDFQGTGPGEEYEVNKCVHAHLIVYTNLL